MTMSKALERVTRDVSGKPVVVGDVTLLPTVQARGWSLGFGPPAGGAGGWFLRLRPGPLILRGPDGQELSLPLDSTADGSLRTFSGIGAGVAAVCALLIVAARRR